MADKLGLGNEVRQLKLGQSFTNPKSTAFHTIRYDFKPASVDVNKIANVEVGSNHQVTVTVPHLGKTSNATADRRKLTAKNVSDGAGVPQTVFKGPQRPYQKECVLIIDRLTGAVTLEKLSSNIQVKKTRSESVKPPLPQGGNDKERANDKVFGTNRPQTPPIAQRISNKTRVTSGSRRPDRPITHLVPKHSPLHASPNYPSPAHYKSPKRDLHVNTESHNPSMSASLPIIGEDDFAAVPSTNVAPPQPPAALTQKSPTFHDYHRNGEVSEMSGSSSSSSDSDSDSDQDRPAPAPPKSTSKTNGYSNGVKNSTKTAMPADHFLNEDLNLSDSGSD